MFRCDYCGRRFFTDRDYQIHNDRDNMDAHTNKCAQIRYCKFHICGGGDDDEHSVQTLELDKFTPLAPDKSIWEDDPVINLIYHIIGKVNPLSQGDKSILDYLYQHEYERMRHVFNWYAIRHHDFEDNEELVAWIKEHFEPPPSPDWEMF